jgi:hypothetical protein
LRLRLLEHARLLGLLERSRLLGLLECSRLLLLLLEHAGCVLLLLEYVGLLMLMGHAALLLLERSGSHAGLLNSAPIAPQLLAWRTAAHKRSLAIIVSSRCGASQASQDVTNACPSLVKTYHPVEAGRFSLVHGKVGCLDLS